LKININLLRAKLVTNNNISILIL